MREPPFVAGRFGSVAVAVVVVAAVADLLPFVVVVAWFPPSVAGGPPLPAMPPGNDVPRRPRARPRFRAAS